MVKEPVWLKDSAGLVESLFILCHMLQNVGYISSLHSKCYKKSHFIYKVQNGINKVLATIFAR